jgi:hypothetical protein
VLAFVAVMAMGVMYVRHVDREAEQREREADRRWCELLVTMDDAYGSTPPQTELGRRIATAMHQLRTDFGC